MLQLLRIQNLALLDEVSLEFDEGFTAVTGETGAGKSILLGALRLLSGARADKSIIRQGADFCEVEAALHFPDPKPVDEMLEEMGLPSCEEGVLLLKRTLPRTKIARVSINGNLTTLANLQRIGGLWIDFHGPEDPQKLFQPGFQLDLLDLYAQNQSLLKTYRTDFKAWKKLLNDRDELANAGRLSADEIEFYRGQIEKIDECQVSEEGIEELERSFTRVTQSQELVETARMLADGLIGESGVFSQLGNLQRLANDLEAIDPSSGDVRERLVALVVEAEDLGHDLERLVGEFDFEPQEIEEVHARMNLWLELQRRIGGGVETVLEKRAELAQRLEQQGDIEGSLAKLDREIGVAEEAMRTSAEILQDARKKAAKELSKKASEAICSLGFEKAGFDIEVVSEKEPTIRGGSSRFLFSPNAGQELAPLDKIASSGEIARVMLALKTILARIDRTPVLVFDEVDANVGGEIGRIVGLRMAELGQHHQVVCVTHLPQVAALAQSHLVVEKRQDERQTEVEILSVHQNRKTRIGELARMLGDRSGKSAQAHAKELLRV